uniref:Cytochrome b6-f complex subunit VI n=1 Tax=Gelidium elegans TaxID=37200 RepID=A0A141SDF4_GELEL|nr:cytochrome b6-f complex subunit VI [Gelidium elegans]AMK96322.1 cytochrome b6-f complex subunit VI [Gelidium elegans]
MSIFLSYLLFIIVFTALAIGLYFSLQAVRLL